MAVLLAAASQSTKEEAMRDAILPGVPWNDTDGKPIQAHGGSIIYVDGLFYWYGENKEHTRPGNGIWHWGVRAYSSPDLYNWDDCGLIVPPVLNDESSPLHPSSSLDRPHIIYNARTRKYVCWLKIMGPIGSDLTQQTETILVADNFLGPYTIVRSGLKPLGMYGGDFDLAVDPRDGKGYYFFERVHGEIICADLNEDYTDVSGYYTTHLARTGAVRREAPAHFTRDSKHYLLSSGLTWYFANPTETAIAHTYHGPWTTVGRTHENDTAYSSLGSQISSVFKHPHKRDLYIAIADRWVTDEAARFGHVREQLISTFSRAYASNEVDPEQVQIKLDPRGEVDTSSSGYVWLPILFDGQTPRIAWRDAWRIEDYD